MSSLPSHIQNLHGSHKSWNGEFFVDFLNAHGYHGSKPVMFSYSQKKSENASDVPENGIPANIHAKYQSILDERVTDGWHGEMSWSEAARRDGAPPIAIAGVQLDVNGMLETFKWLGLAQMMSGAAISQMPSIIQEQRNKVNDGFFLTRSPAALASAFFVPPEKAFEAMNKVNNTHGAAVTITTLFGIFQASSVSFELLTKPRCNH